MHQFEMFNGKATARRFVCSNEGHQGNGKTDNVLKLFKAETRIDCDARIIVSIDQ